MPALLPMISTDLQLADSQGAALTVGYTVRWCRVRRVAPQNRGNQGHVSNSFLGRFGAHDL